MIVEMAGAPGEYVKEMLSKHVMILNEVKDIKVVSIKISDPVEVKDARGMYTCFAEADFETENFSRMIDTMFDFMPSSVEIIEPSKVSLDSNEATALLNNLSGRLHRYDELAKVAKIKLEQMAKELEIVRAGGIALGQKQVEKIREVIKEKKKSVGKKKVKKRKK